MTMKKKLQMKLLLMPILMLRISSEIKAAPLAPALYVFGDSLFDAGNNNFLPTLAKADFSPYGMNFDGGPTGRFTDGRTVADFIAEFLGLPYSAPYLSLLRRVIQQDQLKGLNFASASAGILPQTGSHLGKCLNLAEQIGYFEKTVEDELPGKFDDSKELSDYLSKAVFIISIGSNDYINNYFATRQYDTSKLYSPQSFANLLIHNLSQHLQRLYELGARRVIVFEVGAIGCIPSSVRQFRHKGSCVEEINQFALMFNHQLAPMLSNLTSDLQGSSFILGRAHWIGHDAFINPSNYGLSDSSNPCCLTWLNGTSGCIPEPWAVACQHPEKHYFFDGYHLTETLYKTIATLCFNGSSVCIPKNIQDLLSQV